MKTAVKILIPFAIIGAAGVLFAHQLPKIERKTRIRERR